jgi:hypothetical protein
MAFRPAGNSSLKSARKLARAGLYGFLTQRMGVQPGEIERFAQALLYSQAPSSISAQRSSGNATPRPSPFFESNRNGSGAVFKTDASNTWSDVSRGLPAGIVSALVIDPDMPSTLCAGAFSRGGVYEVEQDADGNNKVTIGGILTAVNFALSGRGPGPGPPVRRLPGFLKKTRQALDVRAIHVGDRPKRQP